MIVKLKINCVLHIILKIIMLHIMKTDIRKMKG
jgi:hypothetical protein